MTRSQIAAKVRTNLDDEGITYYTASDINESIQDGYDEVAVYCECIEKFTRISFVSNTTYYDLSTLIPDYYRVIKVYSSVIRAFLEPADERTQLGFRQDWELANYSSRDFIILGTKYVGFPGRSENATGTFDVSYKAQAGVLNDTSTPLINANYQILLEHYATADLLEQNEEFVKASKYWKLYDPKLEEYREKVQLLAKSDRVFAR